MTVRPQVKHPEYDRISETFSRKIDKKYDVVIIGSGYGGAISASRWARAGRKVCVLERGKELVPGEYPTTFSGLRSEMQIRTDGQNNETIGKETGLFDLRVNEDVSALVGCGLGGTSLILSLIHI